MYPVTTVWFDKIKVCIGWSATDRTRVARLYSFLDSNLIGLIEALGRQVADIKDTQPLMANARFVQRLHDVLYTWLVGLLDGDFDDEYAQARCAFGQRLREVDLLFEDLILLEALARRQLFELARENLDVSSREFLETMHSLDKALCLDLALIHSGYLIARDTEIEQAVLNRFLAITGFSRTLYENLAEAQEWHGMRVHQRQEELS